MQKLRNLLNSDKGVSNVIGAVLLIVITVTVAAAFATFVLNFGNNLQENASAEIDTNVEPNGDVVVRMDEKGPETDSVEILVDGQVEAELSEVGESVTISPDGGSVSYVATREDGTRTTLRTDVLDSVPSQTTAPSPTDGGSTSTSTNTSTSTSTNTTSTVPPSLYCETSTDTVGDTDCTNDTATSTATSTTSTPQTTTTATPPSDAPSGNVSPSGSTTYSGYYGLYQLEAGSQQNVFSRYSSGTLREYDSSAKETWSVSNSPSYRGLEAAPNGGVYTTTSPSTTEITLHKFERDKNKMKQTFSKTYTKPEGSLRYIEASEYTQNVYIFTDQELVKVQSDGTLIEKISLDISPNDVKIGQDGTIYILDKNQNFTAYDENGNELWSAQTSGNNGKELILNDGSAYVIFQGPELWKYDTSNGDVIYSKSMRSSAKTIAMHPNGYIYATSFENGTMGYGVYNPSTGNLVASSTSSNTAAGAGYIGITDTGEVFIAGTENSDFSTISKIVVFQPN